VSCWSSVHLAHAAIKLGTEGTKAQELNFIVSLLLFVFLLGDLGGAQVTNQKFLPPVRSKQHVLLPHSALLHDENIFFLLFLQQLKLQPAQYNSLLVQIFLI
jgi:hypothetical protein